MSILNRFRREPRVHLGTPTAPVHPEESDPLMDQVVQACSYDLPGFTVVRQEAEAAWVAATVAAHLDALDEWTSDVFDVEIGQRHLIRLGQIGAQQEARHQDATRALRDVEAVITAVALRVAALRDEERHLRDELSQWTHVLTGQRTNIELVLASDAEPPVVARPVPAVLPAQPASPPLSEAPAADGSADDAPEARAPAEDVRPPRPTPVADDRAA